MHKANPCCKPETKFQGGGVQSGSGEVRIRGNVSSKEVEIIQREEQHLGEERKKRHSQREERENYQSGPH